MKRDEFLSKGFQLLIGKSLDLIDSATTGALTSIEQLADSKKRQRPPGAISPDKDFQEKCTGCDACMAACPFNVIMIEDTETRYPLIFPDEDPCVQCVDTPCVQVCPTQALLPFNENNVKWGDPEA